MRRLRSDSPGDRRSGWYYCIAGFEGTAKDRVHLLVIFDPSTDRGNINRYIGECGIPADCHESRPGTLDTLELLERAEAWSAVTVAPHVTTGGGLLDKLSGQSAVRAWTDNRLHAVGVGGGVLSQAHEAILSNRDAAYKRTNPLAILAAADICSPADVSKSGGSSWIKLSSLTISGLDLAFRTPETRVSRDDPTRGAHAQIVGLTWEGGFLDGVKVRLKESLNVLIDGRGSGKSTVLESIRYALGIAPLASSSKAEHDAMVKNVLGAGTKVRLEMQIRKPSVSTYTVERLVGSKSVVRDSAGTVLQAAPVNLLRGVSVYGQRELAELVRDKGRLTSLLAQYLPDGTDTTDAAAREARDLQRSRQEILALHRDLADLDDRLARVPVVTERLSRFDEAGVGAKLRDQEQAQQERDLLDRALSSLPDDPVVTGVGVETDYLTDDSAKTLPRGAVLDQAKSLLEEFNRSVATAMTAIIAARDAAKAGIQALREEWNEQTQEVRGELERVLRELQPGGIDGDEYLRLRRELATLAPLTKERG